MFIFMVLLVFAASVGGTAWAAIELDDIKLTGLSIAAGAIIGTIISILVF